MTAALHTAKGAVHFAQPRIGIDRILHPRSIAVFGASDSLDKFGGRIMHFLTRHNFAGDIYPINLNRAEVAGRKAYQKIAAVPAPPDVGILAVPPEKLIDTLREAADAGVGCCVVISTGFAEVGDASGAVRQAELVDVAARTGMRVVGPNCMGMIVPHHHMALCSSVVLNTDTLGDGSIGLISQSGALMVTAFDRAKTDGIGLRYGVSLGNQSDVEICDFLEYMIEEPETKAICLYIEGLLDGARFHRAAAACRAAGKPLLLVKTGRTEAGVTAAQSHTASLAGSFEVFAAVCRDNGVVIARDIDDMLRAAHFLVSYPQRRRRADGGVGVISSSGGTAGISSDRVSEVGLRLARTNADTRAAMQKLLLPPQAGNPIDLGGRVVPESVEIAYDATRLLLADPDVDYGMAVLTSMPFIERRSLLIAEAARDSGKPCITVLLPGAAADPTREAFRKRGFLYLSSFEDGLRVIGLVAEHDRLAVETVEAPARPNDLPSSEALRALPAGQQTEGEVKRLLGAYGVKVAREAVAATPAEAGEAAARLGFPVVLKAVSRDIVHKSDVGAVRVGLADRAAVVAAAEAMRKEIAAKAPSATIEGFSVQEMVRGQSEVIVGVRRDPQFGPVVLVGLGGIAVEILGDVAVAPAPVSRSKVRQMIAGLKSAPLFQGARGKPPLDMAAIADSVERIGWLAADLGDRLIDLEVNPLIVGAEGQGAVAVDGRARLGAP